MNVRFKVENLSNALGNKFCKSVAKVKFIYLHTFGGFISVTGHLYALYFSMHKH